MTLFLRSIVILSSFLSSLTFILKKIEEYKENKEIRKKEAKIRAYFDSLTEEERYEENFRWESRHGL